MVVGIHTVPAFSIGTSGSELYILIRQLLNAAVPIFLSLSAFFISNKKLETSRDIISFWKKQIPKVYLPCLIWSIPYLILSLKNGDSIDKCILNYIGCGYSIYYFIALIIQLYLLTPILLRLNLLVGGAVCSMLSLASIALYVYSNLQLPLILYAGPFVIWIMFYMQGIIISKSSREYSIPPLLIAIAMCVIFQMLESKYLYSLNGRWAGIKPSAFIYSVVVILLLFSNKVQKRYELKTNLIKRFIEYIGRISFSIYLVHMFIVITISRFLDIQCWIINWSFVLIMTIIVINFLKSILPVSILRKYLGIL